MMQNKLFSYFPFIFVFVLDKKKGEKYLVLLRFILFALFAWFFPTIVSYARK